MLNQRVPDFRDDKKKKDFIALMKQIGRKKQAVIVETLKQRRVRSTVGPVTH